MLYYVKKLDFDETWLILDISKIFRANFQITVNTQKFFNQQE